MVDVFGEEKQNRTQMKAGIENQMSHRVIGGQRFPPVQDQKPVGLVEDDAVENIGAQGKDRTVENHSGAVEWINRSTDRLVDWKGSITSGEKGRP